MCNQLYEPQEDLLDKDEEIHQGRPGIMVLSSLLKPLHVNRRAIMLLNDLALATPEGSKPNGRTDALPPPLGDLAGKILGVLQRRRESGENGQCEICYLADNSSKQVVIRCIGLPSWNGTDGARIVFVLSDTNGTPVPSQSIPMEVA